MEHWQQIIALGNQAFTEMAPKRGRKAYIARLFQMSGLSGITVLLSVVLRN